MRLSYARHHKRVRRIFGWSVGAVAVLGIGWVVLTSVLLARDANQLKQRLREVHYYVAAGQTAKAQASARAIPKLVSHAESMTSGPAWWTAIRIPYLGRPFKTARLGSQAMASVGRNAIPPLVTVTAAIDPATIRTPSGAIRIQPLEAATPALHHASVVLQRAERALSDAPHSTWFGAVDDDRATLQKELDDLTGYVQAASRAATVLPPMLGSHGTQTYFVGLQNEAEMRGTGGLPGAFAIVSATGGTIRFTHFGSDAELLPDAAQQLIPTHLNFGRDYDTAYGASMPSSSFGDSNASPHFPYAAQIWAAMWQKVSGQRVDGAIAVDPTMISYMLAATGPVRLTSGLLVTDTNVVALTQKDQYTMFTSTARRRAFLVSILKATSHRLIAGDVPAAKLVQGLSISAKQHRVLVWSRDSANEKLIAQTSYAGVVTRSSRPLAGLIMNNESAGKLDYYLKRTVVYQRSGCGPTRDVVATVTLRNDAPSGPLPDYVTERRDKPPAGAEPGDSRTLLDFYATQGAVLQSVSVNGRPSTAAVLSSFGHPIVRLDLELRRGTATTVEIHLKEPAGQGTPVIWRQPGVTPLAVQEFNQSC